MLKSTIKYTLLIAGGLFAGAIAFSPDFRTEISQLFSVLSHDAISKLEAKADQGELALTRYEQAYREQANKLASTIHNRDEALSEIRRAKARAEEFRAAGKETRAMLNERDVATQQKRHERACRQIEKRGPRLKIIHEKMEIAREEVRILRKNIEELRSMRDAMDNTGLQDLLDKAEQNVANLNSQCISINAEISQNPLESI